MNQEQNILARKQFEKRMEQEKKLGYPSFKKQIAKDLVEMFNIQNEVAHSYAFSSEINDFIMSDISWAQHMGTEYWAESIYKKYFQKKMIS